MSHDLNFLLSHEAAQKRYLRTLAYHRDLDMLGGEFTHVVHLEKGGKFTEFDASGKLHALTLLNEMADNWSGVEALSIRRVNDDGTLGPMQYHWKPEDSL